VFFLRETSTLQSVMPAQAGIPYLVFVLLFACFNTWPALANDISIARVTSGDTFVLNDNRIVRLEGIKAPGQDKPELAQQSQELLQNLTKTGAVVFDGVIDRYGRSNAQIYVQTPDGKKTWLQGEMLKAGLAFLYPPTGNEANLADMEAAEAAARQDKRGIWADAVYADLPADQPDNIPYGQFVFVSGKVVKAERVKNKFYLNFGDDWHTDFAIAIAAHDLKNFRKANIDPASYQGKTVRVRGWVIRDFGPMMTVTHPAQIEVLK
jgi:micrococcal nuclease